jgi:uncharacterized membrane protein YbhN (UPF0104 family)
MRSVQKSAEGMPAKATRRKSGWSRYLVYVSLLFLLLWLVRSGYLYLPVVHDPFSLLASFFLLLTGFAGSVLLWWRLLEQGGRPASLRTATASTGLIVFGKYVPGKIWTVIGRAGYVSEHSGYRLADISAVSLNTQIVVLWFGIPLGSLALLSGAPWGILGWSVVALWLGLTVALVSDGVRRSIELGARRLGIGSAALPSVTWRTITAAAPFALLVWIAWAGGFSYLAAALTADGLVWGYGASFVLAATAGIVAVVSPGGLGVREGVLTLLLVGLQMSPQDAATLSVASRLWFLAGEGALFIAGVLCHLRRPANGPR